MACVVCKLEGDHACGPNPMQQRTDVSQTATTAPTFNKRVFSFSVPPDAEPGQWSLQVSAIAVAPDSDSGAKQKTRVIGSAVLALGDLISPLLQDGAVERTVQLEPAEVDSVCTDLDHFASLPSDGLCFVR